MEYCASVQDRMEKKKYRNKTQGWLSSMEINCTLNPLIGHMPKTGQNDLNTVYRPNK